VRRATAPRTLAPLTVLVVCLVGPRAGAQPVDPGKLAAAQALFDQAQAAIDKKDYASACPKLEEVTHLLPNGIGGQVTLAQCYEGAGRLASAWSTYVVAQAAAARALRPDQEKQARERAQALKAKLAQLTVVVPDATRLLPGLSITRDGIPVGAAQWGTPSPVDKGKHAVVATATGKPRWEKVVEVPDDGAGVVVEVAGLAEAPAAPPPREPPGAFWSGLRIGGASLVGVGLVGVGVGSAFGAIALAKKNQSGSACGSSVGSSDPNFCTGPGAQLRSDGLRAASISTGTFIAGGVVLAAGVTLFAVAPRTLPKVEARLGPGSIVVAGAW
jgi:hypothetical protein